MQSSIQASLEDVLNSFVGVLSISWFIVTWDEESATMTNFNTSASKIRNFLLVRLNPWHEFAPVTNSNIHLNENWSTSFVFAFIEMKDALFWRQVAALLIVVLSCGQERMLVKRTEIRGDGELQLENWWLNVLLSQHTVYWQFRKCVTLPLTSTKVWKSANGQFLSIQILPLCVTICKVLICLFTLTNEVVPLARK